LAEETLSHADDRPLMDSYRMASDEDNEETINYLKDNPNSPQHLKKKQSWKLNEDQLPVSHQNHDMAQGRDDRQKYFERVNDNQVRRLRFQNTQ